MVWVDCGGRVSSKCSARVVCVQGMEENGPMHLFVLDEQGVIWHRTRSAILPSYSYCATTGLGAGILIAAWMVSGRLKKEKNPAQESKK